MSDEQIMAKAIQKAIDNGWDDHNVAFLFKGTPDHIAQDYATDNTEGMPSLRDLLFDHSFAKALWPESKDEFVPDDKWWNESGMWYYDGGYKPDFGGEEWMFHLQNMAVADDLIKYLGEHL